MPDRFSEFDPMDAAIQRRRLDPDYFLEPECNCRFSGDQSDASDCDLHGLDAGDWNPASDPCPVRHRIFLEASTVGAMVDALNCHRLEYCEACGQLDGFVRLERAA